MCTQLYYRGRNKWGRVTTSPYSALFKAVLENSTTILVIISVRAFLGHKDFRAIPLCEVLLIIWQDSGTWLSI